MELRRKVAFEAVRIALRLGSTLPRSLALPVFGAGGVLYSRLERRGRKLAGRNLAHVFGDKGEADRLAGEVFRELGRNAVDLARLERISGKELDALVQVSGYSRLERAIQSGKGVIGITAHLGNWELLSSYLGNRGIPLTVLARPLFDRRLDERLVRLRARYGVRSIVAGETGWIRETIRRLQNREMIGILMDLHSRSGRLETRFLGRPARAITGPVRLAGRTGSTILPMACWRTNEDRYTFRIEPPVSLPARENDDCWIEEGTDRCNEALERFVLRAPAQWVWMHDRWGLGRVAR